jgi:hypothetical protein
MRRIVCHAILSLMSAKKISEPEFCEEEIVRRRDAVIKHMLNTPPKPHSEMKIGKRKAKAKSAQTAKRERSK